MEICRVCLRRGLALQSPPTRSIRAKTPLRPLEAATSIPRARRNAHVQLRKYSDDADRSFKKLTPQKERRSIFSSKTWRDTWKRNPGMTALGGVLIATAISLIGYASYQYYQRVMSRLSRYPKRIEEHIRRGLWHKMKDEYPKAIREFQAALRLVPAFDMDPTSDEVTGLKIMFATVFAEAKMESEGIAVLVATRDELILSLDERRLELGEKRRAEVMAKCIGIGRLLGRMYLDTGERDKAEEALIWAIDTAKKEKELQNALWPDEIVGALFEQLADFYQATKRPAMATPLYLEALTHINPPICHSVVLMNNVGTSMVQTPIPQHASISPAEQQEAAKKWHLKAIEISSTIRPPKRTPECDEACIINLLNLGQLEQKLGNTGEARKRFLDAENLSRTHGLTDWKETAESLLQELEQDQAG